MTNKTLVAIIVILLLTNLGLLYFFLQKKEVVAPKKGGFTERLKKDVGFTSEQIATFEPRKKAFWQNMRVRFDDIKKAKQDFFFQIYDSTTTDSMLVKKAEKIGELQKEMDLYVFRHFKDIRNICTPDQQPKFDSLMPAIVKRMTEKK